MLEDHFLGMLLILKYFKVLCRLVEIAAYIAFDHFEVDFGLVLLFGGAFMLLVLRTRLLSGRLSL